MAQMEHMLCYCVGDGHCVQLYGFAQAEEAAQAWDKVFSVSEVPVQ